MTYSQVDILTMFPKMFHVGFVIVYFPELERRSVLTIVDDYSIDSYIAVLKPICAALS